MLLLLLLLLPLPLVAVPQLAVGVGKRVERAVVLWLARSNEGINAVVTCNVANTIVSVRVAVGFDALPSCPSRLVVVVVAVVGARSQAQKFVSKFLKVQDTVTHLHGPWPCNSIIPLSFHPRRLSPSPSSLR